MRTTSATIGTSRAAGLAAALALVLFGAGCAAPRVDALAGPLTLPPAPPALTEFDPSAEGVEVALPEGAPGPMAKLLARSVVEGLSRHNVPGTIQAVPAAAGESKTEIKPSRFVLLGQAGPNRDPALNAVVAIEWRVIDRRAGREVGRFVDGVAADQFSWDNGDPRVIYAVGENAAHGFSTLVMRTPPVTVAHGPSDLAAARPASVSSAPAPRQSTIVASLSSDPTRPPMLASPQAGAQTPAFAPAASAAVPESPEKSLFLVPVSGAPGDGNGALTRAIRAALGTRGHALAETPRAARYLVAGSVSVGKVDGGRQPVRIVWEVSDPQGRMIGRAVQENDVSAGSLEGPWGSVAAAVAGAAVPGITDVLRRAEVAAAQPAPSDRRLKIPPTAELPPISNPRHVATVGTQ